MGDFSASFHRPESGIHTIEGNVAGARAAQLSKKRQREQEEFEKRKQQIASDAERSSQSMNTKFSVDSSLTDAEKTFKEKTVGLVTAQEFKKLTEESNQKTSTSKTTTTTTTTSKDDPQQQDNLQTISREELAKRKKAERKARKKAMKKKKKLISTLSFVTNDEDEALLELEEEAQKSATTTNKNPEVDTSFLPDRQRDEHLQEERQRLEHEWEQQQHAAKSEKLEIVYSYWDGSGHRRNVVIQKGDTIGDFLELVRSQLSKEFREMQNVSADALLYVKEDLMIPQDLTFYDLIATRARGKSGPLFHFDVHEDIRVGPMDARIEKDESHPGKVVERRWYDRNKHIFPASRWETFDPSKEYGTYTIHGGEVTKKEY